MKVYPLLLGSFEANDSTSFRGGNPRKRVWFASYAYYIECNGKNIIVDTGFAEPQFCENELNHICRREEGMSIEQRLDKIGLTPLDIDIVILTHCHWDHIGNLNLFTKAKVYCQREEISWSIAPPVWQAPAYPKPLSDRLFLIRDRLEVLDGDLNIEKGISLRKVGAHSPGSQMIFIKENDKEIVITGDVVLHYANLERNVPIGTYHNLEEAVNMLDFINNKIIESNIIVLPSHDPEVWEKYKDGISF